LIQQFQEDVINENRPNHREQSYDEEDHRRARSEFIEMGLIVGIVVRF
jgi:hypothetical protein